MRKISYWAPQWEKEIVLVSVLDPLTHNISDFIEKVAQQKSRPTNFSYNYPNGLTGILIESI